MAADADEGDDRTVPWKTHVLPLRTGRIEVVGESVSVHVDMERLHIGRSRNCALVLNDPTVSKVHAEVQATQRGVRVADLDSLNGTFVGKIALGEVYLNELCDFQCGAKRLRFVPEAVLEVQIEAPVRFGGLIGTTPEMIALFEKLGRYARTSMPILIQGETGTGKERVARAIHEASPRRDKPYVPINCAALAENLLEPELFGHVRGAFTGADRARDGVFVEANGGTLLFDEVGEMSAAMQSKLLRVLETQEVRPVGSERSRKVDVRMLFATHVDLCRAINDGRFRDDLYYRMAQVTVEIPPLNKRLSDLPILIADILTQLGRPHMIVDEAAMNAVLARSWPGNVRQLRSVIEAAVVESDGDRLEVERALAGTSTRVAVERPSGLYDDAKQDFDRRYYAALYTRCAGNITQMAKVSGRQRGTVKTALAALGLGGDGKPPTRGT
jgi:DNA-binding NtrC family response regulator